MAMEMKQQYVFFSYMSHKNHQITIRICGVEI